MTNKLAGPKGEMKAGAKAANELKGREGLLERIDIGIGGCLLRYEGLGANGAALISVRSPDGKVLASGKECAAGKQTEIELKHQVVKITVNAASETGAVVSDMIVEGRPYIKGE